VSDELARARDFDALVRAHHGALLAFATRLCRDAADAHDLTQDALERALRRFESLTPGSNARAWLFTILHNAFIDRCRRKNAAKMTPLEEEDIAAPTSSTQPAAPPAWTTITPEQLRAAVDSLDEGFRDVYRMHALEGRSYEEISRELGVPTNTVGTRLARARRKLKAILEKAVGGEEKEK
jgi:RNA polymerase sigma-70 factor (ECF subfamily)